MGQRSWAREGADRVPPRGGPGGLDRMIAELRLKDDQKDKVQEILKAHHEKMDQVMTEQRSELIKSMKSVLDGEQLEKLERLLPEPGKAGRRPNVETGRRRKVVTVRHATAGPRRKSDRSTDQREFDPKKARHGKLHGGPFSIVGIGSAGRTGSARPGHPCPEIPDYDLRSSGRNSRSSAGRRYCNLAVRPRHGCVGRGKLGGGDVELAAGNVFPERRRMSSAMKEWSQTSLFRRRRWS